MLKRANRLSRITVKKSSFFNSAFFTIRVADNKEKETRFGVVVSKKTSKKAVLRNKTKRILRNIITENIDKILKSKDIIIVSKQLLNKRTKKEADQDLMQLFKAAKIIK